MFKKGTSTGINSLSIRLTFRQTDVQTDYGRPDQADQPSVLSTLHPNFLLKKSLCLNISKSGKKMSRIPTIAQPEDFLLNYEKFSGKQQSKERKKTRRYFGMDD